MSREKDNMFIIPDSFLYKSKVRIMGVYENDTILRPEEYALMGPRKIKMLREVSSSSIIYGKIVEIKLGNRLLSR